jgi:hypothetical protein
LELKHAWLAFAKCSAQWTILNADLCVFRDDSNLQNVPPYGPERHQIFALTNAVMLTNVTDFQIGIPFHSSHDLLKFEMYEGDVQSVLRCRQCNKPFDKGELYLHQILLRDAESVLTVWRFRVRSEETWILLSV